MDDDRNIGRGVADARAGEALERAAASGAAELATYNDLISFVSANESLHKSEQQERNRISSLMQFLEHLGQAVTDPVGQELGAGLNTALISFVAAKKAEGLASGSLANMRSHIRQWSRFWESHVALKAEPKFAGFTEAFEHYLEKFRKAGGSTSMRALSRAAGLHSHYLAHARSRGIGIANLSAESVARLEEHLGAPTTSLTRFCSLVVGNLSKLNEEKKGGTEYAQLIQKLQKEPYALKEYPPRLLAEVRDFIRFKTTNSPAPLKRNLKWGVRPKSRYVGTKARFNLISLDGKRFSPAATIFVGQVERFFGFLVTLGHSPERFSLVQMCDVSLLSQYLDFAEARVGVVTKGATDLILTAQAFLFNNGGWIYQQPRFASLLLEPVDSQRWPEWCAARDKELSDLYKDLKKDRTQKKGRDVRAPIKQILERQHPVTALFEMVENMERYLDKHRSMPNVLDYSQKMVLERDLIIFKIMIPQPLRANMLTEMTYKPDNSGNLYQREGGHWAIKFNAEDFKNEAGAASDRPYDVALPEDLTPDIDAYINEVRPRFPYRSEKVFVPTKSGPTMEDGTHGNQWFNTMIRSRSRQFIPGCVGFGPHAIRHIVATEYIKNNPGSYMVAAHILHDKLETVIKAYAHLEAADGHRVYTAYLGGLTAEWRKGR